MYDLVSVIVITYNSAEFVLHTLESVRVQTHKSIELIVSDDCSTDNTIEIVRNWVEKHKNRFLNTLVIESDHNTGIAANCNRGFNEAQGKYLKYIAGDDLLLPNCIEDNYHFANENHADFLFSKYILFSNDALREEEIKKDAQIQSRKQKKFYLTRAQQYSCMLRKNFVSAPTNFISKKALQDLTGFNEEFLIEDHPLWIKALQQGYKLYFLDKNTVQYRISYNSISSIHETQFMKRAYLQDSYKIYHSIRKPHLSWIDRLDQSFRYYLLFKVVNGKNTLSQYQRLKLLNFLNPFFVIANIRNLFIS